MVHIWFLYVKLDTLLLVYIKFEFSCPRLLGAVHVGEYGRGGRHTLVHQSKQKLGTLGIVRAHHQMLGQSSTKQHTSNKFQYKMLIADIK